jgi:hypothetical protein
MLQCVCPTLRFVLTTTADPVCLQFHVCRPQFEGEPSTNPVNGQKMLYFPASVLLFRTIVSANIIGMLIMIVLCIVASIFVLRIALTSNSIFVVGGVATGSIIAAVANAVQIQVRTSACVR